MWHKARAEPSQRIAGRPHLLGWPATPPWLAGQGLVSLQNLSSPCVNIRRQEGYTM
jgi:hypothetical protein